MTVGQEQEGDLGVKEDRKSVPETKKIVVFLTVKGGAGRTSCLSNVAWLLAKKGNRVLVVDGDVEAPGLSILNAFQPIREADLPEEIRGDKVQMESFRAGGGLMKVAQHATSSETKPLSAFMHPVIAQNSYPASGSSTLLNDYFKMKFGKLGRISSKMNGQEEVDETFWHPNGEMWILPVGKPSKGADDLFSSYRNSGVTGEVLKYLQNFLIELVKEPVRSDPSQPRGVPIFDYVLVDTRAGFDKWTIDILLPAAGQIAMVAHLNQQGRRETNRLLYDVKTMNIYNDESVIKFIKGNGAVKEILKKEKVSEIWDIPISFYSQILPPGENFLRSSVFDEFISVMKYGKDSSFSKDENEKHLKAIPSFYTEKSDIVQIYYNSSLPLDEDIVSIDEDPQNYSSAPYWLFMDSLLKVYREDISSVERFMLDCFERSNFFDSNFVELIPLSSTDDLKRLKFMDIDATKGGFANISEYVEKLAELRYLEPRLAQSHAQRLFGRVELLLKLLASEHPEVKKTCELLFYTVSILPSKLARSGFLGVIGHLISCSVNPEYNWITTNSFSENLRLGGGGDFEGTVTEIESNAGSVHVATRYLNYDINVAFQDVVLSNLKSGVKYNYYLDTSNNEAISKWIEYYNVLQGDKDILLVVGEKDEFRSDLHVEGMPSGMVLRELIAQERYDLVFYEKQPTVSGFAGAPFNCILFPAHPPNDKEIGDEVFISTNHPVIIGAVQRLLSGCPTI